VIGIFYSLSGDIIPSKGLFCKKEGGIWERRERKEKGEMRDER